MTATKLIVCLANSRKHNGRCIAGIELIDRRPTQWVRPVSDRPGAEVSEYERQYPDGSDPRVLDILEVPLLDPAPDGYQTENWLLDPESYWMPKGRVTWKQLARLEDEEQPLWPDDAPSTRYGANDRVRETEADGFGDSLRLIYVDDLTMRVFAPGADFNNPKRRVQGGFSYLGTTYRAWVTDPVVERDFLAGDDGTYEIGDCYVTMSLGERSDDGYCYKLIAALITEKRAAEGALR